MLWKEDTRHHSINTTSSQVTSSNGFPTTHHVETAQLRFSGDDDDSDSEVVANPNTEV